MSKWHFENIISKSYFFYLYFLSPEFWDSNYEFKSFLNFLICAIFSTDYFTNETLVISQFSLKIFSIIFFFLFELKFNESNNYLNFCIRLLPIEFSNEISFQSRPRFRHWIPVKSFFAGEQNLVPQNCFRKICIVTGFRRDTVSLLTPRLWLAGVSWPIGVAARKSA